MQVAEPRKVQMVPPGFSGAAVKAAAVRDHSVKSRVQWLQILLMGGKERGRKGLCFFVNSVEKRIISLKIWKTSRRLKLSMVTRDNLGWLYRKPIEVRRCQWLLKITELWNCRMVCVERDLRAHLILSRVGTLSTRSGCSRPLSAWLSILTSWKCLMWKNWLLKTN